MVDVIQRLILESEVGNTQKELEQVRKEQTKLEAAIRDGAKATDKASDEYQEQVKALKALVDRERELEKQIQNTNDAYGDRRNVIKKTDNFDRVSQDVSLAGDVESNLRTVGGAVGAFGGAGLERGIGQAAELGAVVEALPRLQASFAGMPQTINAAVQALGTSKAAFGGLVVGIAALGVALQLATAQAEKQRAAAQGQLEAQRAAIDFAATATREQLEAEIEAARQRRDLAQQNAQLAKEQQEAFRQQLAEVTSQDSALLIEGFSRLKLGAGEFEALRQNVDATKNTASAAEIEVRALEQALASGATAANDAAEAERRLADERTQGVLNAAQQAGDLERANQQAANQTREENQRRAKEIENERKALQEQLNVLKASGDTSDTVTQQIKSLETQIANLGAQADVFKNATGKAAEGVKDAANEIDKAAAQASSAASGTASGSSSASRFANRRAASRGVSRAGTIGGLFSPRQADSQAGGNEADDIRKQAADAQADYLETLADLQRDFEANEQREARRAQLDLARIQREGQRAETDAARERNFAALADAREQKADQISDFKEQQAFDRREREIAYREQQADAQRNYQRQLNDLQSAEQSKLNIQNQALGASLNIWQQWANNFIALTKRATGSSGSTSGQSGNIGFNQLNYIQG